MNKQDRLLRNARIIKALRTSDATGKAIAEWFSVSGSLVCKLTKDAGLTVVNSTHSLSSTIRESKRKEEK